ncbi:hypothetical protein [Ammoniphilus sp. 3BR4]|uniref:hypothetical protein n=1 Tax=Ammoniphilus sp. 3BR4 TaxID=3158265 RepID=UPI00346523E3
MIEKYLDTLFLGYDIQSVSPIHLIEEEKEEESMREKYFKKSKTRRVSLLVAVEKISPFLKEAIKHSPQWNDEVIYYIKEPLDLTLFHKLTTHIKFGYRLARSKSFFFESNGHSISIEKDPYDLKWKVR